METKNLGEAIILQSLEDLFSSEHRRESMKFFMGQGFGMAADIAGLDASARRKIRVMIISAISSGRSRHAADDQVKRGSLEPEQHIDIRQGGVQCTG